MRAATKVFAVAAVLGAIGGSVFLSSRSATANGFSGPFAGGTQRDTTLSTSENLCLDGTTCSVYMQYDGGTVGVIGAPFEPTSGYANLTDHLTSALLGRDLSLRTLVLTKNEVGADTLVLLGGRLRLAPYEVNANAWIDYDVSTGIRFGQQMNNCAGCALLTDVIYPRQNGIPVTIGDADGVTIACQSSPGTCDSTHKGAAVCVTESASSATRICRCIRTSSTGDYRWLNTDNSTRGTTTTDCPDTTP